MATMYEIIMDLPLFKGVSKDHVSAFLEKTHLEFKNFHSGEQVVLNGEPTPEIGFVFTGRIRSVFLNDDGTLRIGETSGQGKVIGADVIYGIYRNPMYSMYALDNVSVMTFSKKQYVNLLYSDPIYMLNFFNYLSLRVQRPLVTLKRYGGGGILSHLAMWINMTTDQESSDIRIEFSRSVSDRFKADSAERSQLAELEDKGVLRVEEGCVHVADRGALLEAARNLAMS